MGLALLVITLLQLVLTCIGAAWLSHLVSHPPKQKSEAEMLFRHVDSLLDRLASVDWQDFHRARMQLGGLQHENARLAFLGGGEHQTVEEREINAF